VKLSGVTASHRRWLAAIGCLAAVACALLLAKKQSTHLTFSGFAVPSSQSAAVNRALKHYYPQVSRTDLAALLWTKHGATAKELEARITNIVGELHKVSGITLAPGAVEKARFAAGLVGPILIPLRVTAGEQQAQTLVTKLDAQLQAKSRQTPRVETHVLGEAALAVAVENASKHELSAAERVGFPVLLLILLAVFGSIAAAALPLALAAVALLFAGAIIYSLSLVTELSTFTTSTASMFGIGVAVDYSLIILTRLRQELATGRDIATAQRVASRTAGRAVVFSGVTVVLSLSAVWIVPIGALRSMAAGAMIAVAVSVLLAVTMLPRLTIWMGAARLTPKRPSRHAKRSRLGWQRWTRMVTTKPLLAVLAVTAIVVPLCIPAAHMKTSTGALEQLSQKDPTRKGFEEARRLEGPGTLGPLRVVVHGSATNSSAVFARAAREARDLTGRLEDVHEVSPINFASHGLSYAMFTATLSIDPESSRAKRLVTSLRSSLQSAFANRNITAAVGGATASAVDEDNSIAGGMWRLILIVLLSSFVILSVLLRSIVLPLKAIAMNLISVGVAYGTLVIVFQWGWFDGVFHYTAPGHVYPLVPPLLLAVVFGLSMDYEVFLLARIREQWELCDDQRLAIANGLAASGVAITSAAFILVCVFCIFIGVGNPTIKELGVGAAMAVGLDATLIRLVLVPAVMTLLGRWNWWFPKAIDQLLPPVSSAVPDSAVG